MIKVEALKEFFFKVFKHHLFRFTALFTFVLLIVVGAYNIDEVLAPTDLLVRYPAWKNVISSKISVRNHNRSDTVDGFIPYLKNQKKRLYGGRSIDIRSMLVPSHLIFMLISDDAIGFHLGILFKLFMAGLGFYLFIKQITSSFYAGLFGAVSFAFCEFNVGWIYASIISVTIWTPWLCWAIILYLAKGKIQSWFLILFFAIQLIMGWFPAMTAYILGLGVFLILSWPVTWSFKEGNMYRAKATVAIFLAFVVCAPFVLGKADQLDLAFSNTDTFNCISSDLKDNIHLDHSSRTGGTTMKVKHLLKLLWPKEFGLPFQEHSLFCGLMTPFLVLIACVFGFLKGRLEKNARRSIIIFAIATFLSFLLAWGLIDHEVIKLIPTFNFNLWNRLTFITSFSIILLASIGFHLVIKSLPISKGREVFTLILVIASIVQLASLFLLFRQYNSTNPKEYFYPRTETIEYVSTNIGDLNFVIADASFFGVNGALRYYGLNDWFDHSSRSKVYVKELNSLIQGHRATATASVVTMNKMAPFNDPVYDHFAIQYLLTTSNLEFGDFERYYIEGSSPTIIGPKKYFDQNIQFSKGRSVKRIAFRFGTYGDHFTEGKKRYYSFELSILDRNGDNLTSNSYSLLLQDNAWQSFIFDENIRFLKGESYTIRLKYLSDHKLAIYKPKDALGFMIEKDFEGDKFNDFWRKRTLEPGVNVYENINVPKGPYLLEELSIASSHFGNDKINWSIDNEEVNISVGVLNKPSFLILPMRIDEDFEIVNSNGECEEIIPFRSILPAIRVSGDENFRFKLPL